MNLLELIHSDWKRYFALHHDKFNIGLFPIIFFRNPGMLFSVFYRVEHVLIVNPNKVIRILGYILYIPYFIFTYYLFDIDIPPHAVIGKGLYVHNKGIVFTENVIAGDRLTLVGPLTVGRKGVGDENNAPTIGNNVVIFAGARVIGNIKIGNDVLVGANAVVVKNVPGKCVVGGVPAKIIKRIK